MHTHAQVCDQFASQQSSIAKLQVKLALQTAVISLVSARQCEATHVCSVATDATHKHAVAGLASNPHDTFEVVKIMSGIPDPDNEPFPPIDLQS